MESEGNISVGSPPLPDSEIVSVGSPNDLGFQASAASSAAVPLSSSSCSSSEVVALTDDLRDKIIRQVEYYFSDENLPTDKFLMKYVEKDKEGFVPIAVIASFRKMRKLVQDISQIVAALKESSQLVLSSDGKKLKRINPLPVAKVKDVESRSILVENLPEDYSIENLQRIFGDVGKIKNICIQDPHAIVDSSKASKSKMTISGKLHAVVEYETMEAAEKAVATLNDERNWRSGMRVEPLLKRMGKYGFAKKGGKKIVSEKNNDILATGDVQNNKSLDHHNEMPEQEEEVEHLPSEKVGGRRGRGRGRSRVQKQHNVNGQGHGSIPSSVESLNKPPPGPRMPDGTRGFTMGRGRALVSNSN